MNRPLLILAFVLVVLSLIFMLFSIGGEAAWFLLGASVLFAVLSALTGR